MKKISKNKIAISVKQFTDIELADLMAEAVLSGYSIVLCK